MRYTFEINHEGLGKHRIVTGFDPEFVQRKAKAQMAEWNALYARVLEKDKLRHAKDDAVEQANDDTQRARKAILDLESILEGSLESDPKIDWESLKIHTDFPERSPIEPILEAEPREPRYWDPPFQPSLSFFEKIFKFRADKKRALATKQYELYLIHWKTQIAEIRGYNAAKEKKFIEQISSYNARKATFVSEAAKNDLEIDNQQKLYSEGGPSAVHDYCDLVLSRSDYPDYFPHEWEIEFIAPTHTLIVDYDLPGIEKLPRTKEVKFIKARNECRETKLSESAVNELFDSVVYQICLRTIRELFLADAIGMLEAIVFNGYAASIDRATGLPIRPCIVSIHVTKTEFKKINLSAIDPKVCFRKLKGVGSSKLHSMSAVAPILVIDRNDRRFVDAHSVTADLDVSVNLAAMDWEEFEHLIRELFEVEFKSSGGEVKVTQASRDGGVDAVAFDPDPIRGGKIIIQAKRYTNTVGVSAVRDLYGTLLNEGANKGILVTTSDYGPDAFEFAKGKPITLLNGGNLLYLLEKHGHKAKIDIREAKMTLAQQNASNKAAGI